MHKRVQVRLRKKVKTSVCLTGSASSGLRMEIHVLPGECPEAYAGAAGDMDRKTSVPATTRSGSWSNVPFLASWKMQRGDSVEDGLVAEDTMDDDRGRGRGGGPRGNRATRDTTQERIRAQSGSSE